MRLSQLYEGEIPKRGRKEPEGSEDEIDDVDMRKKDTVEKIIKPITSMAGGGTLPPDQGSGKRRGPPGAGAFGLAPTR